MSAPAGFRRCSTGASFRTRGHGGISPDAFPPRRARRDPDDRSGRRQPSRSITLFHFTLDGRSRPFRRPGHFHLRGLQTFCPLRPIQVRLFHGVPHRLIRSRCRSGGDHSCLRRVQGVRHGPPATGHSPAVHSTRSVRGGVAAALSVRPFPFRECAQSAPPPPAAPARITPVAMRRRDPADRVR